MNTVENPPLSDFDEFYESKACYYCGAELFPIKAWIRDELTDKECIVFHERDLQKGDRKVELMACESCGSLANEDGDPYGEDCECDSPDTD